MESKLSKKLTNWRINTRYLNKKYIYGNYFFFFFLFNMTYLKTNFKLIQVLVKYIYY